MTLSASHHGYLVALPVMIAVFGSYIALDLFRRARVFDGRRARGWWLAAAVITIGFTVWSVHLVALLADTIGSPVIYDRGRAMLPLLVAIGGSTVALVLALREQTARWQVAGAVTVGLVLLGMHHFVMAAEILAQLASRPVPSPDLRTSGLALDLAAATSSILVFALIAAAFDRRFASVASDRADSLRQARDELGRRLQERTRDLVEAEARLEVERRRAEEAARESEARLWAVVESLPFDLWVCDLEGRYMLQNSASRRNWGDRLGLHPEETGSPPEIVARWVAHNARALAGETVRGEESHAIGGELRHVEKVLTPIECEGEVLGCVGVNIDVTARKRAADDARASEERLQLAIEATRLGIWDVEPVSGARVWSPEFKAILGLPPEAAPDPAVFAALIHPEDREEVVARYRRTYEPGNGGRYEAEHRIRRHGDGAERWIHATGRVFFDGTARPTRAVGTLRDVTDRRRAHEALRESEERYRVLLETSPDAVFVHRAGVIVLANTQAAILFGADAPEALVARNVFDLVDEASLAAARERTAALATPGMRVGLVELTYRRLNGTPFPVEATAAAVQIDGRLVVQVVFRDITARKAAEAELHGALERLSGHMKNTPLGVIELAVDYPARTPGRVRAWSGQAEAIFGWRAQEALGRTLEELALFSEGDVDKVALVWNDLTGDDRRHATATLRCATKDQESRQCCFHASIVQAGGDADGASDTVLLLVEDVTERLATLENVQRLAHHDTLTELPNRLLFQDRLEQALHTARRQRRRVALMLLDLDHFKEINDSLGHPTGDQLLRDVAERLSGIIRATDTWARLGGDEFALVQTALHGANDAKNMVRRFLGVLERPFMVEGQRVYVTASLGVTLFPDDGDTPERLMRNADMALYRAKAAGRRSGAFYRPEMDRELQASRSLQAGLRQALEEEGLVLAYQPVVDVRTLRIVALEALVRWRHPGGGEVPPATFIPIAETSGLIQPLGGWVLRQACRQAAAWHGTGLKVAVNVSVAQLRDPELLLELQRAIEAADIPAACLELEVTESVFLDPSKDLIVGTLQEIAALGVSLAIDDFGAGYSSLGYLKNFPFDKVKIDGSFVRDIGRDQESSAIVAAVVALGHALGKQVTAEWVEEEQQLAFLTEHGCDLAQGYLLGPPQPAEAIDRLLAQDAAGHRQVGASTEGELLQTGDATP